MGLRTGCSTLGHCTVDLVSVVFILCVTGVFIARSGAKDVLVTKNLTPGESVYGEKRISVDVCSQQHVVG